MRAGCIISVTLVACLCCLANGIGSFQSEKDVVELARGINDLSTLVTTLKAGDLVTALQGKGPFTVFAPTNAAFGKLPHVALERLLKPENKQELVGMLTYHMLAGSAVYSKDLKARQEVKTLQGQNLLIESPSPEQITSDIEEAIRVGVPLWYAILLYDQ